MQTQTTAEMRLEAFDLCVQGRQLMGAIEILPSRSVRIPWCLWHRVGTLWISSLRQRCRSWLGRVGSKHLGRGEEVAETVHRGANPEVYMSNKTCLPPASCFVCQDYCVHLSKSWASRQTRASRHLLMPSSYIFELYISVTDADGCHRTLHILKRSRSNSHFVSGKVGD